MEEGRYYSKRYIQFNILEGCRDRTFDMLPAIRALKVHSTDSVVQVLDLIHWKSRRLKLYRSVAKLKNIPFFTFNMKERSSETAPWFLDTFQSEIFEYDLFIDFDNHYVKDGKDIEGTFDEVLMEVKKLLQYFDEYGVPYSIQFSGNHGFQIFIDGRYMPKPVFENGAVQPHKRIAENIKEAFDFKFLDLRNNGVPNRLCKVPYSLCLPDGVEDSQKANFPEEEMNVVLPLSNQQVQKFKIENIKLEKCYKDIKFMRRGNLERFSEKGSEEKVEAVNKFINSVDI